MILKYYQTKNSLEYLKQMIEMIFLLAAVVESLDASQQTNKPFGNTPLHQKPNWLIMTLSCSQTAMS